MNETTQNFNSSLLGTLLMESLANNESATDLLASPEVQLSMNQSGITEEELLVLRDHFGRPEGESFYCMLWKRRVSHIHGVTVYS